MLKIDNSLLVEIGLASLPDAEKNSFLKHVYETLEMRVGIRLADQMSNEQLDEFERYFEAKDDAGAFKWLETNFPNYKEIVQEEFDKLKSEVAQSAPDILAASQAQAAAGPTEVQPATQAPIAEAPQPPVAETPQQPVPLQPVYAAQPQPATPEPEPYNPQPVEQPANEAPAPVQQQPTYQAPPAPLEYTQPTTQTYPAPAPSPQAQSEPQQYQAPFPNQQPPAGPMQ